MPATQFCCGCGVPCGVKFIIILNLIGNVSVALWATVHTVFKTTSGFASYGTEMFWLGWCLSGLPLIAMAYHGVNHRNESMVRIYFHYMQVFMVILIYFILQDLVFTPACQNLPLFMTTASSAWACGVARWIHVLLTVVSLSIFGYFNHVVYSYCEDLAELGGGPELGDLMLNKEAYMARWQGTSEYSSLEGMQILKEQGWMFEQLIAGHKDGGSDGVDGSVPLFGKNYHDTNYPPNSTAQSKQEKKFVSKSQQQDFV